MKKCKHCGKKFESRKSTQKFCSRRCYRIGVYRNPLKACVVCNKEFKGYRKTQKYCSKKCGGIGARKPLVTCEYCGGKFRYVFASKNRFCSYPCAQKGQRTGRHKKCEMCDNTFWVTPSRDEKEFCCSRECRHKRSHRILVCRQCGQEKEVRAHIVESGRYRGFCCYACAADWQKGENHSSWKGGHQKWRGPNWLKQRKKAVKRDNHTCQNCGITEQENGKSHDVHHVIPWREFDNDWKKANRLSNLTSLCQRCHTTLERRHNRTNQ